MSGLVYLDHASQMEPPREVTQAVADAVARAWGHPSALHPVGREARRCIEQARVNVASLLGVPPIEVTLHPSGAEALVRGVEILASLLPKGARVATSAQNHPRLGDALQRLPERALTWLSLPEGAASEEDARRVTKCHAVALSIVNHELGTHTGGAVLEAGEYQLLDASAAVAWIDLHGYDSPRTLYAFSGSKLGAPRGIGVLRVPRGLGASLEAPVSDHEGLGTAAVAGLGAAASLWLEHKTTWRASVKASVDMLLAGFRRLDPHVQLNGSSAARIGTIANVSFRTRPGAALASQLGMRGVCIAHTSACRSAHDPVSSVLASAHGGDPERVAGATRWSPGPATTQAELERALDALGEVLRLSAPGS